MNTEELTQITTAHQSAIARHEQWFGEYQAASVVSNDRLNRIEAILEATAQQQEANTQAIAQLSAEQQLSRQDINSLTASILELRHLVADYIQSRTRTEQQ